MVANPPLPILIESRREPDRAAIRKRAEASIEMVMPIHHQLDRDYEALEDFAEALVRADIGAKLVAAKQRLAAEERVAFALEKKLLRQPLQFVATTGEPVFEMPFFPLTLRKVEIAAYNLAAHDQSRVGGEHHVRQLRLWRDALDIATKVAQFVAKPLPLGLRQFRHGIASDIHPRIYLVFDPIMVGRAKEQIGRAHV